MVSNPQFSQKITPEEYLAWEEKQEFRYEYIDGEIVAMTGASLAHNRISLNFYTALRPHLVKRNCEAFVADVKVQDQKRDRYFYPDLVITCDTEDQKNEKFIQKPSVIVEVLSPSTRNYDQRKKFKYYRQIASLQEYILIDSEQVFVELYRKQKDNMWSYDQYELGETLTLTSIDFECSIESIYEAIQINTELIT